TSRVASAGASREREDHPPQRPRRRLNAERAKYAEGFQEDRENQEDSSTAASPALNPSPQPPLAPRPGITREARADRASARRRARTHHGWLLRATDSDRTVPTPRTRAEGDTAPDLRKSSALVADPRHRE